MKEYRFNIHQFADIFRNVYSILYEARQPVPGYREALDHYDKLASENPELLQALFKERNDFISSDRECVAFVFTFYGMIKNGLAIPA